MPGPQWLSDGQWVGIGLQWLGNLQQVGDMWAAVVGWLVEVVVVPVRRKI